MLFSLRKGDFSSSTYLFKEVKKDFPFTSSPEKFMMRNCPLVVFKFKKKSHIML